MFSWGFTKVTVCTSDTDAESLHWTDAKGVHCRSFDDFRRSPVAAAGVSSVTIGVAPLLLQLLCRLHKACGLKSVVRSISFGHMKLSVAPLGSCGPVIHLKMLTKLAHMSLQLLWLMRFKAYVLLWL